jgi:hypothetical protein
MADGCMDNMYLAAMWMLVTRGGERECGMMGIVIESERRSEGSETMFRDKFLGQIS